MSRDKFFYHDPPPGDLGGVYRDPRPGIYEKLRLRRQQPYDDADTASPKVEGNHTTRGRQQRALIVHPEFPLEDK